MLLPLSVSVMNKKRRDWEREIEIAWALCIVVAVIGVCIILYAVFFL